MKPKVNNSKAKALANKMYEQARKRRNTPKPDHEDPFAYQNHAKS